MAPKISCKKELSPTPPHVWSLACFSHRVMIHPLSNLNPILEGRFVKDRGPNNRQAAFLAFIHAQEKTSSKPSTAGSPHSELPSRARQFAPLGGLERTSVPPLWARAHEVARGRLPTQFPPHTLAGSHLPTSLPELPSTTQPLVNPGTPRYEDVPEWAKSPLGPYRQAPAEYGGEWWFVNPFTGPEPWIPRASQSEQVLPDGFAEIFGLRPQAKDYTSTNKFYAARLRWEQDLKYFKGAGVPEHLDVAEIERVGDIYEEWGMGRPLFYEGRYGWKVRFPDSRIPNFEANPEGMIRAPHVLVAQYQIRLIGVCTSLPATPYLVVG